jgi:Flp pilus assembly protein TadG
MSSILLLLALPVILLFSWFVIEYARLNRYAARARAAADAVALAAAARYADGLETATADAHAAAGANLGPSGPLVLIVGEGPGGGGDLEFGDWDEGARTFTQNTVDGGRAVRATIRMAPEHPNGAVPLIMGGLFGIAPAKIERSSIAVYRPPTHVTSVLLSNASSSRLTVSGTAMLRTRGGIGIPSATGASIAAGPTAMMDTPIVRLAGDAPVGVDDRISGALLEGATVPEDPYASTAQPVLGQGAGQPITAGGAEIHVSPGYHAGLTASSGTIILDPGLHQFGGGISLSGSAVLQLANATVQLAPGAALSVSGSASFRGTCESGVANWSGFAVIQPPGAATWTISGGATFMPEGRICAPGASVSVLDSASLSAESAVLDSMTLSGNAVANFTLHIPEIALPIEPGRARIVK